MARHTEILQHQFSFLNLIDSTSRLSIILKHCPLSTLKNFELVHVAKDATIVKQGERFPYVLFILSGNVSIYSQGLSGQYYAQATYEQGNLIGEIEIFDLKPLISSAKALTDVTLLKLSQPDFLQWLASDSFFNEWFIKQSMSLFYELSKKSIHDKLYPLGYRLACYFQESLSRQTSSTTESVSLHINKTLLSEQFAVTLRSINRILSEFHQQNIITPLTNTSYSINSSKLTHYIQSFCY